MNRAVLLLISFIVPVLVLAGEVKDADWNIKEILSPPAVSNDLIDDLKKPSDDDQRRPDQAVAAEEKKITGRRKTVEKTPEPSGCQSDRILVREGAITGIDDGGIMTMCEVLPSARMLDATWGEAIASGQTTTIGTITAAPLPPAPLTPADAATLTQGRVGFTWEGVSGASSYRIQVSRDSDFTATVIDTDTVSASYTASTALASNTYFWRVKATDAFDNSSEWSPVWSVTVDVAPSFNTTAAEFINNGMVSTNSTTVSLAISAAGKTDIVAYSLSENPTRPAANASNWAPITPAIAYSSSIPYTLSAGDDTKTVYVWFKDAAGRVSKAARDTIVLDTAPPDTMITGQPANPTNSILADFSFESTEAGSLFQCSLDDGAFSVCDSLRAYSGLGAGLHTLDVKATDAAGNIDPTPVRYSWTIDITPPDTMITAQPSSLTNSISVDFSFVSTEAGGTFQCSLDNGAYAVCSSPHAYAGLAEGLHTITVTAIDAAGNADPLPARYAWTIDLTPPDTMITGQPADPTNSISADVVFASTEAGSTFQCSLDGGVFTTCSSPHSYTGLAAGMHTFDVKATDVVGNADPTPARYAWTIDTAPPDTTITGQPADPTNSISADFSFASTEAGGTFQCSLDNGAYAVCTSPHSFAGLAAGVHIVDVKATDAAGNTDPISARYTWTIDLTPPDTAITIQPADPTNSTSGNFSFSSSETESTFACSLDGEDYTVCTSPHSLAGLAAGPHTFLVKATDGVGNIDPTPASYTWTIDITPPDTTLTDQPANSTTSAAAEFSFTATEAGSTFQCSLDGGAYAVCTSPHSYAGITTGPHAFTVKATDAVGNTDPTPASFTWMINLPPINLTPAGFINKNGAYYTHGNVVKLSISATASSERGVKAYFVSENPVMPAASDPGWVTLPQNKKAYSHTVSYTLSEGTGKKTVHVWFKDADGNISAEKSVTIYYFNAENVMLIFLILQLAMIF